MDSQVKEVITVPVEQKAKHINHDTSLANSHTDEKASQLLSAGEWARRVLGFEAPFGHDGLPTVWG